ncbi:tetratricopeptide repeat protein [Leptospira idonii]|uniref:Tetratricopeptide repeat protein n=1 Tax=Leptospira idonii TaxID=1193500 RepID=A0A4R9M323_9LEPT|nr:tetratricopeptide repeat protein [Leptospira idonii]TGN20532.1 tetratricopeptide repeat protein [Leptospira idonii]
MSRFQKNALLTVILLATIAYPPLYYSIRDTIRKESLPKSYHSPDLIPHISLGDWELNDYQETKNYAKAVRELVSLGFAQGSDLVYYGENSDLSFVKQNRLHIVLQGEFEIEKGSLSFSPKIYFPQTKKYFSESGFSVPWADLGKTPFLILKSYEHLIRETIRLHRILLHPPKLALLNPELNSEVLSETEFGLYTILFSSSVSTEQKLDIYKTLALSSPRAAFLYYEKAKALLVWKSVSSHKDIWKEWEDKKLSDTMYHSLLAYRIGRELFFSGDLEKSFEYLQIARKTRENLKQVYHFEYAHSLSLLGQILVKIGKKEEALYYLTSAKEMYSSLDLSGDKETTINLWYHSLLLADLNQKEVALSGFFKVEPQVSVFTDFERALFYFDLGKLQYDLGAYEASLPYLSKVRSILFQKNLSNHELNFHTLVLQAAAQFRLGNANVAKSIWEDILSAKGMLNIEDKLFYRYSYFNLAKIYSAKNAEEEADRFYKVYTRLSPYNAIVPLGSAVCLVPDFILPGVYAEPTENEFTGLEEAVIRSYTGRYIFSGQDEEIRARTYENRLEDTNEFLSDLLEKDFFGTPSLSYLKESLFPKKKSFEKGENIVFLDIGPALNNPDAPGITSQSVAYHFPKMEVVLWELPKEVDLFLKKVPSDKKDRLYSFRNIRILSADGVGKFETEYSDPNHWILKNRSIPNLKDKTIIMRAANSIDIYETYTKIQPHFMDVAFHLKDNPVLYFFNRSILFKPKGQAKFSLIGFQSIRGFHHNFQSLDRNGEPPYTLSKFTLSER